MDHPIRSFLRVFDGLGGVDGSGTASTEGTAGMPNTDLVLCAARGCSNVAHDEWCLEHGNDVGVFGAMLSGSDGDDGEAFRLWRVALDCGLNDEQIRDLLIASDA